MSADYLDPIHKAKLDPQFKLSQNELPMSQNELPKSQNELPMSHK
ncbi:hypothetical protein FACS1894200_02920 [Spirochaetia bacterium]|nr:hypothetical protein FACS1894200_02920 [Spirochaetia bacterium]